MGEGIKTRRGKSKGQVISKTYLYNEGDECTALTGGWVAGFTAGSGSQAKNTDHLHQVASSRDSYRTYVTDNKVDLTTAQTISFEIDVLSVSDSSKYNVELNGTNNPNGASDVLFFHRITAPTGGKVIVSIDISSVNGSYYIGIAARRGISGTTEVKTYKVWLE